MKSIKNIIIIISVLTIFAGCRKELLDQYPLDQISEGVFWTTADNLMIYVNQFYPVIFDDGGIWSKGIFGMDNNSDNFISQSFDERLAGVRTVPAEGGGWDYTNIRSVNMMLDNYTKCEDDPSEYNQYVGEAYFVRAYLYFDLVKKFGDVVWVDHVLDVDSPELYAPRDPRNFVIDHVIKDLDTAVLLMEPGKNLGGTRLSSDVALAFKSRVCLYEGTWEKYHAGSPFGVSNADPEKYFKQAAEAAKKLMDQNTYSIYSTGKPDLDYWNLFIQFDYSDNDEILFWKKYDNDLELNHHHTIALEGDGDGGLTKSFADSFLCTDGQPVSVSPLFGGYDSIEVEMQNRDPRFAQTIYTPGAPMAIDGNDTTMVFEKANIDISTNYRNKTGYQRRKGFNPDVNQAGSNFSTVASIFFRYAEVLLNYAEAKAELGTITQGDIDKTINELRDRAGMPHLNMGNITPDPNWPFPDVSPIINEVRRERRVELSLEGFRWDDIARWAAADELIVGKKSLGAKFVQSKYPDMTPEEAYADDPSTNGFIWILRDALPGGWGFNVNRDYLDPLPTGELTLNPALGQNPGW